MPLNTLSGMLPYDKRVQVQILYPLFLLEDANTQTALRLSVGIHTSHHPTPSTSPWVFVIKTKLNYDTHSIKQGPCQIDLGGKSPSKQGSAENLHLKNERFFHSSDERIFQNRQNRNALAQISGFNGISPMIQA
jgi:hypothetical protein